MLWWRLLSHWGTPFCGCLIILKTSYSGRMGFTISKWKCSEWSSSKCATLAVECFELKSVKILRKGIYLPLNRFREGARFRKITFARDNYKEYGLGVVSWGSSAGPGDKISLSVPVSVWQGQTFLPNICSYHNCLPSLWSLKNPLPFSVSWNYIWASIAWPPVGVRFENVCNEICFLLLICLLTF